MSNESNLDEVSEQVSQENSALHNYVCITGYSYTTKHLVEKCLNAFDLGRIIYNAASDRFIPFSVGVTYRLACRRAWLNNTKEPIAPDKNDNFLPVPKIQVLIKELTKLRCIHHELRKFSFHMLQACIDDACRMVEKHIKQCIKNKELGKQLPNLHFRSAQDIQSISTDAFTLRPAGNGIIQKASKSQNITTRTNRNRKANTENKIKREIGWAIKKRKAGWVESRIKAGLEKRAIRHNNDKTKNYRINKSIITNKINISKENLPSLLPVKYICSRSPLAVQGHDRVDLLIKGIDRFKIRLSQSIPLDGVVKKVTITKTPGHDSPIEVKLVVAVPRKKPAHDVFYTGEIIHHAVMHLAPNAPASDYIEAAQAAGIEVRGDDANISAPSCDDMGRMTKPVKRDRARVATRKGLQRQLTHKAVYHNKVEAHKASKNLKTDKLVRKLRRKRTKSELKILGQIRKMDRDQANLNRTRACQDAAWIVHDTKGETKDKPRSEADMRPLPLLVATDPRRMVRPLLAKGGPVERKKEIEKTGHAKVDAVNGFMTAAQHRTMRDNLHRTRIGLKIQQVEKLCAKDGVIHVTPGHEGTTRTCSRCDNDAGPKGLNERMYVCLVCGLKMPRDQNSARTTLGRGLKLFRDSSDPGGRMAQAVADQAKKDAATLRMRAIRSGKLKSKQGVDALCSTPKEEYSANGNGTEHRKYSGGVIAPKDFKPRHHYLDSCAAQDQQSFDDPSTTKNTYVSLV